MSPVVKLGINCLVVAGLTLAGILLFANLPRFTLEPIQWAGRHFGESAAMAFWFVYTVFVWAVLASVVAWGMLLLEPRKIALYGFVSAVTFVVTSHSWSLIQQGNALGYAREFVFVLTIPTLYWIFVRVTRNRLSRPAGPDTDSAGTR